MKITGDPLQRYYTAGGLKAHYLRPTLATVASQLQAPLYEARCGLGSAYKGTPTRWRGAGTPEEIAEAKKKPLCRRCAKWATGE